MCNRLGKMPARKMGREVGKVGTAIRPQCRSGPVKERGTEVSDDDAVLQASTRLTVSPHPKAVRH